MELLEQHFDTAFSAPNGIQKLRELILTLATQGKLVPQDPSDAPASQLLKEIEAEKKRLTKEGKIKAPKQLPEITSSDAPYALPQGWQWVRLGSVEISSMATASMPQKRKRSTLAQKVCPTLLLKMSATALTRLITKMAFASQSARINSGSHTKMRF